MCWQMKIISHSPLQTTVLCCALCVHLTTHVWVVLTTGGCPFSTRQGLTGAGGLSPGPPLIPGSLGAFGVQTSLILGKQSDPFNSLNTVPWRCKNRGGAMRCAGRCLSSLFPYYLWNLSSAVGKPSLPLGCLGKVLVICMETKLKYCSN